MSAPTLQVLHEPRMAEFARPRPAVVRITDVPGAFYVGRAYRDHPDSGFGNPVKIREESERDGACLEFAELFTRELESRLHIYRIPQTGALACWCSPKKCHGHVIAATLALVRMIHQPCPRCRTPVRAWINRFDDTLHEFARCPQCGAWENRARGSFTAWLETIW